MSTPREIEFEDIRKGDDIDVVWVSGDRMDIIRGTAHHKDDNGWWLTHQGEVLVTPNDDGTILLRKRTVLTEPEGLGAIVWAVVGGNGWYFHRIGTGERPWINIARNWHAWSEFDSSSIEVLYEGKE